MSEPIPGVPRMTFEAGPLRRASVVVLFRKQPTGFEVFWLLREQTLQFAAGFRAFPGGKLDRSDEGVSVVDCAVPDAAWLAGAARELFEEAGVLLATKVDAQRLEADRAALLAGKLSFAEVLAAHGGSVDGSALRSAGRWITPPYLPVRFDTRFFLAELPAGQSASVVKGELAEGSWIRPAEALSLWSRGIALMHPPQVHALEVLRDFEGVELACTKLSNPPYCTDFVSRRIEFQRGVLLYPLETATLPPATHTNCYVLGTDDLLIVDPGSFDERELVRFAQDLAQLAAEGRRVRAIVLTHHHGDHIGGVEWLRAKLNVPVWAHRETTARVSFSVDRELAEGDVLELSGPLPMKWKVLHTPGHARGHVCLVDEVSKAGILGDMVAGVGTIVIDPPEGDMGHYLEQLARLKSHVGAIYPSHGPVIAAGVAKLDEYLAHRAWREGKVLEALRAGAGELGDLVPRAYDDVASFVYPLAERSTLAILLKLQREGVATQAGSQWSAK